MVNDADLAELREKREDVGRKLEFALDKLDGIGRDAVKAKTKKWQNELRSIDKRIQSCRPVPDLKGKDVDRMVDVVIGRVTELGESIDALPLPATRRLLETVIHRAVVDLETRGVELELRLPSWLLDASKPMCLDTTFAYKTDIEPHHENGVTLTKMRLMWWQRPYEYGAYDFGYAA